MVSVKQIKNFASEVVAAVAARLLPTGGAAGDVLTKTGSGDYAMSWQNPAVTQTDIEKARIRSWFL